MASTIDVALDLVVADLSATGAPCPRVDHRSWQDREPSESVMLYAADGSGMGVWLDLSLDRDQALVHLADQVQEWVIEELGRQWRPTNWPSCPGHPLNHLRVARVVGGRASWVCPVDGQHVSPVGRLGED